MQGLVLLVITVTTVAGRNVFIGREEASQYLRQKRSNTYFEELWEGNAERECIEETCSYEEVREVFENDEQSVVYWRQLADQCNTDLYKCNRAGTYKCQNYYNSHKCLCKSGYFGTSCQNEVSVDTVHVCNTDADLCLNGGTCVDDVEDTYYCLCPPGWYGTDCSIDDDECEYVSCNNGTCANTVGSFTCTCDEGYQGASCDIEQP